MSENTTTTTTTTPTEPLALVGMPTPDGKIEAFACATCRTVVSSPLQFAPADYVEGEKLARDAARRHCDPRVCACGTAIDRFRTQCAPCATAEYTERDRARLAAQLAKARHVPLRAYDVEYVFDEDTEEFLDRDALEEKREDGTLPAVLWGTYRVGFKLDAQTVIDAQLEAGDHHEGAADGMESGAYAALQAALDAWRDTYASRVCTYFPDHAIVVDVPEHRDPYEECVQCKLQRALGAPEPPMPPHATRCVIPGHTWELRTPPLCGRILFIARHGESPSCTKTLPCADHGGGA